MGKSMVGDSLQPSASFKQKMQSQDGNVKVKAKVKVKGKVKPSKLAGLLKGMTNGQ